MTDFNLQVDIGDVDVPNQVASVSICNKLRFPMTYSATGAGTFSGIALPRSNVTSPVSLTGSPGDPFVISASFSTVAATTMAAFLALEILPQGDSIVAKLIERGPLSPEGITMLGNAARACDGAAEAARTATDAGPWQLLACLRQNADFLDAVVQLYTGVAADLALEAVTAAALRSQLSVILAGQAVNRIVAETVFFGQPADVSFPIGCAARPPVRHRRPPPRRCPTRRPHRRQRHRPSNKPPRRRRPSSQQATFPNCSSAVGPAASPSRTPAPTRATCTGHCWMPARLDYRSTRSSTRARASTTSRSR